MPFLAGPAASAMVAAAPAAATAATTAAATATVTATLTSVATNILMNVAISAVMSALSPQVGAAGRTFEWTLDPDGPIPFAAGRVGVAGSAVYRETFGPDLMYYGIPSVISGAGPIDGFESFLADDESVTFDATGKAVSSQYAGELWYKNSLGAQPATAITSPAGLKSSAALPGWTSAHKLSGKASYMIVMGENSKGTAFPTGEIKPLVTIRGLKGWDPRLDSSYPGGSGSCRLNNPATWVYLTNPILWALKWSLGLWEGPTGKGAPQVDYQVGGIGAKLSGIDVPAFVSAANVADANGWTVAAYPTTDDDKAQVLDAFLQAGGATYAQRAGKISCIQRAAPRTSIVTISAADTAGPLEIDTAASRIDRINTIRPRYWSEAHRWQLTALPEVTASAYQAQDGGKRTRGIDYPYVSNPVQAAQLAALQIANTREGIAGIIPLKPHLQRIRPGDAFTITEENFVLNGVKCLCLNTDYDPQTGIVRVSFVSETDAKYPFALGQSPDAPVPPVLTPVDTRYVSPPLPNDWTVVITPPTPGGGGTLPGLDLTGDVSNATADAMLVSWRAVAEGEDPDDEPPFRNAEGQIVAGWVDAGVWPPTTQNLTIQGPQPGAVVWVAIRYKRGSNISAPSLKGPLTVGSLIAGGLDPDSPDWDIIREAAGAGEAIADAEARMADALATARSQLEAADAATATALSIADARLTGAVANLNTALDDLDLSDIDGFAAYQTNVQTLLNGKASNTTVSALQTQTNGLSSRLVTAEQAITDLPNNYASASVVGLIKSEVETARNGSASLNAQLGTMRTAVTDGLAGKASVTDLTNLTTRVTSAEGVNTAQNSRLSTVESDVAGKASAGDLTTLQTEVTAARSGSASLLARLVADRLVVTDGLAGKATASDLTALTTRVTTAEGVNTAQNARLSTVETDVAGKASATDLTTLQAEITGARSGSASLLARLVLDRTAVTDGLAGKASTSALTSLSATVDARPKIYTGSNAAGQPQPPGPRVIGDQWIVTNDGNKPFVWTGSAWVDNSDGRVAALLGTTSTLSANYTAQQTAISDLQANKASTSSVTALESSVSVRNRTWRQVSQPTNPMGGYALVAGDRWINTTAGLNNEERVWSGSAWLDVTDPRVATTAQGVLDINAKIGTFSGTVADALTGKASATDLTSLTTRVTTAEGVNTAQNTRLTTAESDIAGKAAASTVTALSATVDGKPKIYHGSNAAGQPQPPGPRAVNDVWIVTNDKNKPYYWNGSGWVETSDGRIADLLGTTSTLSANYTSQQTAIANLETGKATVTSVTNLTARVGTAEANITSAAAVAADAQGKANAVWGVQLDVNGRASGFKSVNDGTTSSFDVLADRFTVTATGTAARTEFSGGIWYAYDASNSVRSSWGRPHGASLSWWTGPNSVAKGSETKANAYVYISTTAPRFGGSDVPGGGSFTVTAPVFIIRNQVGGTGTITSAALATTVAGASGSVSWTWTNVFGDLDVSVSGGSTATPTFSANPVGVSKKQAIFAYSATDAGSGVTRTGQVAVTISRDA